MTGIVAGGITAPILIHHLGFQKMAVAVGGLAFFALLSPLFGEREKVAPSSVRPLALRQALAWTLANVHFRWYCAAYITFWFGFRVLAAVVPFLATVVLGKEKGFVSILLGVLLVSAVLCIPRL